MRNLLTGKVVSTKMTKTVIVEVTTKFKHPLYRKIIRRHKRYKVHNEELKLKEGDMVKMIQSRPLSKDKNFTVIELVK